MTIPSCRSPHGEHGLKSSYKLGRGPKPRRSPHGEHGLKCQHGTQALGNLASLPARGAWIEILPEIDPELAEFVAPRTGSMD